MCPVSCRSATWLHSAKARDIDAGTSIGCGTPGRIGPVRVGARLTHVGTGRNGSPPSQTIPPTRGICGTMGSRPYGQHRSAFRNEPPKGGPVTSPGHLNKCLVIPHSSDCSRGAVVSLPLPPRIINCAAAVIQGVELPFELCAIPRVDVRSLCGVLRRRHSPLRQRHDRGRPNRCCAQWVVFLAVIWLTSQRGDLWRPLSPA